MKNLGWREIGERKADEALGRVFGTISWACLVAGLLLAFAVIFIQIGMYVERQKSPGSSLTGTQPETP